MKVERLSQLEQGAMIEADLAIVGGGPVGLTIARECAAPGRRVIVLESGLETPQEAHEALNRVECDGDRRSDERSAARERYHAALAPWWSDAEQPYGVRCRALGGATHGWAGKSALFDPVDFERRPYLPASGWPLTRAELDPYLAKAIAALNLSPREPDGAFEGGQLRSFYWQFARSRVDRLDIMRFGRDLLARPVEGLHVLLDATVTGIGGLPGSGGARPLEIASLEGRRATVRAGRIVLAASAIENARLLLLARRDGALDASHEYPALGRYLIDHLGVTAGQFASEDVAPVNRRFGFRGVRHEGRSHMFMHGLALDPALQREEGLLNAAVYFMPQRAPDDPWDALKRLLRGRSRNRSGDLASVIGGAGLIAKGMGMKLLHSPLVPAIAKDAVVNAAIRLSPNLVAEEFEMQGYPHKLTGLAMEAICEQAPRPENRVTLGEESDAFGNPLPRVEWSIGETERRTLALLARKVAASLEAQGLPAPALAEWALEPDGQGCEPIDMAHSMGTTRMADDPSLGVVDRDCRVHGVEDIHVAGGSVFPTGGHANPTLMMVGLAIRLAERLDRLVEKT